jgi:hypothetical protein
LERHKVEARGDGIVGFGGGSSSGFRRVFSAPDMSELRKIQESGDYDAYGTDGLRGLKWKRAYPSLHGTSMRQRSQSVMDFEQYFDDENLAGDLLLQFAGIAPAESEEGDDAAHAEGADSDIGSISHGPVTKVWGKGGGRGGHLDSPRSPRSPNAVLRRLAAQQMSPGQPSSGHGALAKGSLAIGSFGALKARMEGSPRKETVLLVSSSTTTSNNGSSSSSSSSGEVVPVKEELFAATSNEVGDGDGSAPADETAAGTDTGDAEMVDQRTFSADGEDDGALGVGLDIADDDAPHDAPHL